MLQDSINLIATDPGKPFQKLVHSRAGFNVLKKRGHRNSRPTKQPSTTDLLG